MDKPNESVKMINMFTHPVFLAKGGFITETNDAAAVIGFSVGMPVADLLPDCAQEYAEFTGGYLSLALMIGDMQYLATVMSMEEANVFHLHSTSLNAEFRIMALIAQQLRQPLSGIMNAAGNLLPAIAASGDAEAAERAAQMNRNLYQMLRQVNNLSAVQRIAAPQYLSLRIHNITALIHEIMACAADYADRSHHKLQFMGLKDSIHCLADSELIERSIYNLISNAVKFAPEQATVTAKLSRTGSKLYFSIQNPVSDTFNRANLFARFMREPGIEDVLHGIGLGLPLIQYTASVHKGTLLMDLPEENTIRFTMMLPIRQNTEPVLRSPGLDFDYLGGYNHALVELSDILSDKLY